MNLLLMSAQKCTNCMFIFCWSSSSGDSKPKEKRILYCLSRMRATYTPLSVNRIGWSWSTFMPSRQQYRLNSRRHTQAFHSGMASESLLCKCESHHCWNEELRYQVMGICRAKGTSELLFYTCHGILCKREGEKPSTKCKPPFVWITDQTQPIHRVLGVVTG